MKDSVLYLVSAIVIMVFLILLSTRSYAVGAVPENVEINSSPQKFEGVGTVREVDGNRSATVREEGTAQIQDPAQIYRNICDNQKLACQMYGPQLQATRYLLSGQSEDCPTFMSKACGFIPQGSAPVSPPLNLPAPIPERAPPPMATAPMATAPMAMIERR